MKHLMVVALCLVAVKNGCSHRFKNNPIVTTEQGDVLGSVRVNRKGGQFYSFMSMPYAKPPVGELRFMPPQSPKPWNGVLNGTIEPSSCYQSAATATGEFERSGREDCLYLNVYTKKLPTYGCQLLPVMVFIHGGGNTEGSSKTALYGPEYLLTEDIVLVTINYRLNILGFLSFEDESLGVTGNAAMKDQVLALKWVKKNIEQFGGDPNLVTIFGESSGAASIEYHTLSPLSQGLFHRAIFQSGSVLNPWANEIKDNGKIVAQQLGLQTTNDKEILATLKSLPVDELPMPNDVQIVQFRQNTPVVENHNHGAFLTAEPRTLLRQGNFAKVPMMIGYNSDEGIFKLVVTLYNGSAYDIDFSQYVPNDLNPKNNTERAKRIAEEIKIFYNSRDYSNDPLQEEIDLFTDIHFLYGITTSVKARLAHASSGPIYFYKFSMNTTLNQVKGFNPYTANRTGASHADDLYYLFKHEESIPIKPGSLEDHCVDKLVKLWTNFAKYGNPTPRGKSDSIINVQWPVVEKDAFRYLEIGNTFSMGRDPERQRVEFWSKLYEKYYEHET